MYFLDRLFDLQKWFLLGILKGRSHIFVYTFHNLATLPTSETFVPQNWITLSNLFWTCYQWYCRHRLSAGCRDFLGGSSSPCRVSARQPEAACRSSPCTDLHKHSLASIAQGVGGYGLKHMSWPFQGECGLPCQISAPGVKWCGCLFQTNTHACTHTDSYLFYIDNTMQTQMFERSSLTKIVDTNYMVWEPKWRNCFEEIFGTPIFVPLESHFHFQYFF